MILGQMTVLYIDSIVDCIPYILYNLPWSRDKIEQGHFAAITIIAAKFEIV